MPARELNEHQRWEIAERLDKIPAACWADLCNWAVFAAEVDEDDDPDDYVPSTTGGVGCAMDAIRNGTCYCGKFRTGLEVCRGEA
jgi:hypothetical protein